MTRPYNRRPQHEPAHEPVHAPAHVDIDAAPSGMTRRSFNSADAFAINPDLVEAHRAAGWDLNFKTESIYGQEQTRSMQSHRENGWEEVDSSKVPGFMPAGHKGPVKLEGSVLMRRPAYLTEHAEAGYRREATQQISRHIRSIEVQAEGAGLQKPKLSREWTAE